MEAERRSTLRAKRKPLSDCTNTLPNRRKNPSSSSSSKILKSQTLIKHPKPSNFTSNAVNNKPVPPNYSSPKSPTSTGSNNISNFHSVHSIPHSPDPPAPPTPVSEADCRNSGLPGDQSQGHATARKDKGKMIVDTPIIELSAPLASNIQQISSSAAPGSSSCSGIQAVQSPNIFVQPIRDKEKSTVDPSVVQFPSPFTSKYQMSSSTSGCSHSETSSVHSQKLLEETRKDKGKMVLETPNIEASEPLTPHASRASLAASGGVDIRKSGLPGDQSRGHATARKDKGKMIADTPTIKLSAPLISNPPQISSSVAPGHSSCYDIQAVESPNVHVQTIRDKGKSTVDAPDIQFPSPFTSKYQMSSSTSGCSLAETSSIHSQKLHEETRKDRGKMLLETHNVEASEPSTPHAPLVSLSASGTHERPVTVYNIRRAQSGRKHAAGKMIKKKGLEIDHDRCFNKSGSHTDPLPVRKKKQSRVKDDGSVHLLPQEDIEKLRAYYADIDNFELVEEEVSEDELEEKGR